jgi:hypothetical protein
MVIGDNAKVVPFAKELSGRYLVFCTKVFALTVETARTECSYGFLERSHRYASTAPHDASN